MEMEMLSCTYIISLPFFLSPSSLPFFSTCSFSPPFLKGFIRLSNLASLSSRMSASSRHPTSLPIPFYGSLSQSRQLVKNLNLLSTVTVTITTTAATTTSAHYCGSLLISSTSKA